MSAVDIIGNPTLIPVNKVKVINATTVKPKGTHLLFVIATLTDHARDLLNDADERTDIIHNLTFFLINKVMKVKADYLLVIDAASNTSTIASALLHDQLLPAQHEPVRVSGYSPQATQTSSVASSAPRSRVPSEFSDLDVLDCALYVLCDTVRTLQEYIEKDRRENIQIKKGLGTFFQEILFTVENTEDTKRTDGEYVWKITSFRKLFMEHKSERDPSRISKYSQLFQTPEGYEFRLRLFLNGAGRGKGTHVSVFLQLCKTDFDDILPFPFKGVFTVTLYDQNPKRKKEHFSVKFKSNDSNCFAKPTQPYNPENGIAKFVSHDYLEQHQNDDKIDDHPIFILNDTIFIGAKVAYKSDIAPTSSGTKSHEDGKKKKEDKNKKDSVSSINNSSANSSNASSNVSMMET